MKSFIIVFSLLFIAFSFYFNHRQNNQKGLGGKISRAKFLWLMLAVYEWFLFPLFLLTFPLSNLYWWAVASFAINLWTRGIAELLMLYKFKNWQPPYGVGHDIFTLVHVAVMIFLTFGKNQTTMETIVLVWFFKLIIMFIVECYYALNFHELVKGNTKGEEGIWFADEENAIFIKINKITTFWNWIFYFILIVYLFLLFKI